MSTTCRCFVDETKKIQFYKIILFYFSSITKFPSLIFNKINRFWRICRPHIVQEDGSNIIGPYKYPTKPKRIKSMFVTEIQFSKHVFVENENKSFYRLEFFELYYKKVFCKCQSIREQ